MPHIVSTLAADTNYIDYEPSVDGGANVVRKAVLVHGGAGVANQKRALAGAILTSEGISTKVSDEDLEFLEAHPTFQLHKKNGHIRILRFVESAEKVAKDMTRDVSAPQTPDTFKKEGVTVDGTTVSLPRVE